jgi:hypothetical protein
MTATREGVKIDGLRSPLPQKSNFLIKHRYIGQNRVPHDTTLS